MTGLEFVRSRWRVPIVLLALVAALAVTGGRALAQAGLSRQTQAGWEALRAGDADRARSLFLEALAYRPADAWAQFGAGVAAHLLGRDEDALASLGRAVELDRRLVDAALLLGEIQYRLGDVDAAVKTYEKAIAAAPGHLALQQRLAALRKESAAHDTMETWSRGSFSIVVEGRSNGALANQALDILDRGWRRIGASLGAVPSGRILVTLYTERQFREFTSAPDWSDGVFDGTIRIPVGGVSDDPTRFERVLTHELVHAMISGLAPRNVPAWLHEGLASYFEPVDRAQAERLAKTLPMIPLPLLEQSFTRLSPAQAAVAYTESVVAAAVLLDRAGARTAMLLWGLGGGQTLETALVGAGTTYAEFETALKRKFAATPQR